MPAKLFFRKNQPHLGGEDQNLDFILYPVFTLYAQGRELSTNYQKISTLVNVIFFLNETIKKLTWVISSVNLNYGIQKLITRTVTHVSLAANFRWISPEKGARP